MKKIPAILLCAFAAMSCHKKMTTGKTETVKTETPVTPAIVKTPEAAKVEPGRVNTALIAAGKSTFESNCAKCHELKNPGSYTQTRWVGILNWMAPKAKISDDQKAQVLAYVQANAQDAPKDKSNMR